MHARVRPPKVAACSCERQATAKRDGVPNHAVDPDAEALYISAMRGGKSRGGLCDLTGSMAVVVLALLNACANHSADENSGGTAGTGGIDAGGELGGAHAGGAGGAEPDQVRIIRGDPTTREWWDLTISGTDFTQLDGALVTVRVGDPARAPERLGSGQARIIDGSFEIQLPQVWEPSLYKTKLAFIDSNLSGQCDPGVDRVFRDRRGTPDFMLTLQNGPRSQLGIPESTDPEGDCSALNATWPTE